MSRNEVSFSYLILTLTTLPPAFRSIPPPDQGGGGQQVRSNMDQSCILRIVPDTRRCLRPRPLRVGALRDGHRRCGDGA